MSDVFIGLEEAAAFEGITYKGLTSRISRNPQQFKTKTQPREGGGKDQVMISGTGSVNVDLKPVIGFGISAGQQMGGAALPARSPAA